MVVKVSVVVTVTVVVTVVAVVVVEVVVDGSTVVASSVVTISSLPAVEVPTGGRLIPPALLFAMPTVEVESGTNHGGSLVKQ